MCILHVSLRPTYNIIYIIIYSIGGNDTFVIIIYYSIISIIIITTQSFFINRQQLKIRHPSIFNANNTLIHVVLYIGNRYTHNLYLTR